MRFLLGRSGMPLTNGQRAQLRSFFDETRFLERGAVVTDLDGTAVHELQGRFLIPESVTLGLERVHERGRPVVINTLRFPLSVIRTFGRAWWSISRSPIPAVLLNGSVLGHIVSSRDGELAFEELASLPMEPADLDQVLGILRELVRGGVRDLLLFFYPRRWSRGEIIWTPDPERRAAVARKYPSAEAVVATPLEELEAALRADEVCMVFLLVEASQDRLMAYQHRSGFFTRAGTDKLTGATQMASLLGFDLVDSIGAGDTDMDVFLEGVGLPVHVGSAELRFRGLRPPLRLAGSSELGELLFELAALQRTAAASR